MRNAGLEETQAGIKIAGRNINNLRYADALLLSRTQGYCYHPCKFHIYALVYCIGVFPSGLLHSV